MDLSAVWSPSDSNLSFIPPVASDCVCMRVCMCRCIQVTAVRMYVDEAVHGGRDIPIIEAVDVLSTLSRMMHSLVRPPIAINIATDALEPITGMGLVL